MLTFYVWEPVLSAFGLAYDDRLMSNPSVYPIIHVFHNYPDSANYNPPGTGTTYPTPTDDPAGVAQAIENWYDHNLANCIGKSYTDRPVYLCIHNTGYWNSDDPFNSSGDNLTKGIFRHPDDYISNINIASPPYEGFLHPFCEVGRSENASIQGQIAGAVEDAGIPIGIIDHDIETLPDFGYSLPGTTADRWLDEYLSDARFASEIAWNGNSHDDVWNPVTALGGDASPNTPQVFYHSSNDPFRSWVYQTFGKNMIGWAFKVAVADPWKLFFPSVKVGNYDLNHQEPVAGRTLYLDRSLTVDRVSTNEYLDFDSPVLYESYKSMFRLDSQANFEADVSSQLAGHGLSTTGDVESDIIRVSVAQAKAKIEMVRAGGKDAISWIRNMGEDTTLMSAFGYTWFYSLADWWEIVAFALDRAMDKFVLWHGTSAMTAQEKENWVALVNKANDRHYGRSYAGTYSGSGCLFPGF